VISRPKKFENEDILILVCQSSHMVNSHLQIVWQRFVCPREGLKVTDWSNQRYKNQFFVSLDHLNFTHMRTCLAMSREYFLNVQWGQKVFSQPLVVQVLLLRIMRGL